MWRLFTLLCFALTSNGASVPSFITLCKRGDDACILSTIKSSAPLLVKGVPELGIKTLDPMFIPLVVSDTGGLKLKFKNSTMTGLRDCKVEDYKSDVARNKQSMKVTCDISLSGQYSLSGKLLLLPVEGKGKYHIDIRSMTVKISIDMAEVTKSGATHWHIRNWHPSYKVNEGATFQFENLFNGNKVLGDPVLEFVNANWKDVMDEVAPPVINSIIAQEVEAFEALFAAVPLNDLILH